MEHFLYQVFKLQLGTNLYPLTLILPKNIKGKELIDKRLLDLFQENTSRVHFYINNQNSISHPKMTSMIYKLINEFV